MTRPTVPPQPHPDDYDSTADWAAAYNAHHNAASDARLWDQLAAAGARLTDCPCGYGWRDSCPVCD